MSQAVRDQVLAKRLDDAWGVLAANGRAEAASRLRARTGTAAATAPMIVVVGETKRGKSELVNALVGTPGVAPVGTDIVTGAYVAYVPATMEHDVPRGTARVHFADDSHQDVGIEDIALWVTVDGQHAGDDRGVIGATVHLVTPGPVDTVVMDTPGVSGLLAGHAQIALRMARQAGALVFVSDAGQDFTAPEAAFLEQAAAEVDTVVFAVTKVDKHPTAWEQVIAHDRALLVEHAPRFADAPMVGVSALMAVEALLEQDPEVAQALRDESRLDELARILDEAVATRGARLAVTNTLRATLTQLEEVEADLSERVDVVKDAAGTERQVTAEEEALEQLKRRQTTWGEDYQAAMLRARRSLISDLEVRISELESAWRQRIAGLPDDALRDQPQLLQFCGTLAEELESSSDLLLDRYVADVTANVAEVLDRDTERVRSLTARLDQVVDEGAAATSIVAIDPNPSTGQPFVELLVRHSFMGFGAANMLGMLGAKLGFAAAGGVAGAAALGPLLLPVAAGAALGLTFMTHKRQKVEVVRRQLTEHTLKAIARLRTDVVGRADAVAAELRPDLLQAVRDHLNERGEQLKQLRDEARKAAGAEPRERLRRAQELGRRLVRVRAARSEMERLLLAQQPPDRSGDKHAAPGPVPAAPAMSDVWGTRPGTR